MNEVNVKELFSQLTLPLKYKLVLSLGVGLVLFLPDDVLSSRLGIQLLPWLRSVLGYVFIVAVALTVAEIVVSVMDIARTRFAQWWRRKSTVRAVIRQLHNLSPDEKAYLATFVRDDTITQSMPINDGIVQSLVKKRIIYRASVLSQVGAHFPHNLQPLVYEHLKKHPEVLR